MTTVALPTGPTESDRIARALATLIGPSITARDGSLVAEDLRTLGSALADAREVIARAVAQAHPGTATDLLPELEYQYGLPVGTGLPQATRQTRLLAKRRARREGTRATIETTLQTIAAAAVVIALAHDLVEGTDIEAIFRLVVTLGADTGDASVESMVDALLAQQAPAYITWTRGRSYGFRCAWRNTTDDSQCDVDLLSF